MHINDASSIADHVTKALDMAFPLADDVPRPPAISAAMEFMISTPISPQVEFRAEQMDRLRLVVDQAEPRQKQWDIMAAPEIKPATGEF